ncbi:hypothetical protein DFH27DRAFT_618721 [Peziza echinospora]|nr:hypothetical protein DFH27DRAFT_618721 [Peziza echinospora]
MRIHQIVVYAADVARASLSLAIWGLSLSHEWFSPRQKEPYLAGVHVHYPQIATVL